jgi:restriction system protein
VADASTTVPPVSQLLWPGLVSVREHGDSVTIEEHDDAVADKLGLTDEQLSELRGDGPRTEFSYRMAWARTWLKGAGVLENSSRGVWVLTDRGRSVDSEELPELVKSWRKKTREVRAARGESEEPEDVDDPATSWTDDLLERLSEISPEGFERLSQRLLREAGFINVEVLGKSGDGGIDGVGHYRMSLVSFPIYFQCKRYSGTVGPNHVRDFRGAMAGRGEKGLLTTTSSFTRDAQREASRDGAPPIELIDGERLAGLLKEHRLGVRVTTETVEHVEVAGEFFDQF